MRRFIVAAAVTAVAAAGTVVGLQATAGAAYVPPLRIMKVQYDSPGTDTRSNASLNAEWVLLRNVSLKPINIVGWTLRDAQNHVYTFGSLVLGSGKTVYVHTGKGTNATGHSYWNSGNYIWNNDGDKAILRNPKAVTQTCTWTSTGSGALNC